MPLVSVAFRGLEATLACVVGRLGEGAVGSDGASETSPRFEVENSGKTMMLTWSEEVKWSHQAERGGFGPVRFGQRMKCCTVGPPRY